MHPPAPLSRAQTLIALWAVGGVLLLLVRAIAGLVPRALEPWHDGGLTPVQWAVFVAWSVFIAWSEGYRAFQKGFSPRVVSRALHLARNPRRWHVVFAPFFAMALFHATRRRMIVSWSVLLGIVALILAVRQLAQPWRGIVDGGVVLGLLWGVASLLASFFTALRGGELADPALPEDAATPA